MTATASEGEPDQSDTVSTATASEGEPDQSDTVLTATASEGEPDQSDTVSTATASEEELGSHNPVTDSLDDLAYAKRPRYRQLRSSMSSQIHEAQNQVAHITSNPQIPKLSREMLAVISEALEKPKSKTVAQIDFSRLTVKRGDLETLVGLTWLNDVIMNAYLDLITKRSRNNPHLPKVHAYDTFLLVSFIGFGFKQVSRWTRSVDIFDQDLLLVPLHDNKHWTMAVVDLREKNQIHGLTGRRKQSSPDEAARLLGLGGVSERKS